MPPHLLIHYHRPLDDYHAFSLVVAVARSASVLSAPVLFDQARANTLTAFGAVFRLDLSLLFGSRPIRAPFPSLSLVPVRNADDPRLADADGPCRLVDLASASAATATDVIHLFVVQNDPHVYISPLEFCLPPPFSQVPRFLFFLTDLPTRSPSSSTAPVTTTTTTTTTRPVLHLYVKFNDENSNNDTATTLMKQSTADGDSNTQTTPLPLTPPFHHTTLFPASPLASLASRPTLFVLDLLALYTLPASVVPVLVLRPREFQPPPPSPPVSPSSSSPSSSPSSAVSVLHLPAAAQVFRLAATIDEQPGSVAIPCAPIPDNGTGTGAVSSDVTDTLRVQALVTPALSRHLDVSSDPTVRHVLSSITGILQSTDPATMPVSVSSVALFRNACDDDTLTVYVRTAQSGNGDVEADVVGGAVGAADVTMARAPFGLRAVSPSGFAPTVKSVPVAAAQRSRFAAVFQVDVSQLGASNALSLSLTNPAPHTEPVKWTRALGAYVVLAPTFPRLLTPAEADLRVYYHRFDEFADWQRWRLRLSSSSSSLDQTVTLRAHRPHRPGVVFFDLGSVLFAHGASVRAELFRYDGGDDAPSDDAETRTATAIAITKLTSDDDPSHPGSNPAGRITTSVVTAPEARDIDRRDVPREWTSGDSPLEMHFVQGDARVHASPPARDLLERTRFVRLRYRRFLPGEYEGWDLWTWDDADAPTHRVAVSPQEPPTSTTAAKRTLGNAWVDFVVDRAQYGATANISLLPRCGGDEWLERDYPVRVFNTRDLLLSSDSKINPTLVPTTVAPGKTVPVPMFVITEGTDIIAADLVKSVRSALTASVELNSTSSVVLRTPVPIAWVSPPRAGRLNAAHDATFSLCEVKAGSGWGLSGRRHKVQRVLRFHKMHQVSPTEVRVHFERRNAHFDEDFPVERVVVGVPGFDDATLQWERLADWDGYLYDGSLGWEYERGRCSFRCFAPTADLVSVVLYSRATGNEGRTVVPMRRIPHGCWKAIVKGNLRGRFYKLLAEGENKQLFPGVEVIDPYSRCNSAHNGRGLIFGVDHTPVAPRPPAHPNHTIVYELHVRDVTIDENSGIAKRGKFAGLCERGSRMKLLPGEARWVRDEAVRGKKLGVGGGSSNYAQQDTLHGLREKDERLDKLSTGLDHIVQMGVNTVQLLPVQDFDNDESDDKAYRWGYMPVHFNSPDGWYASRTDDASRVTEFKQLVDALHRAGLRVVMDVVYNHTAEDSNELNLDARFSFNGLVPRYYYRTCGNTPVAHTGDSTCGLRAADEARCGGCYSNGSGCGNEFRSEAPMGRKFIIDSLTYWVREYGVDGFRFDLLGLLDVDTLTAAARALHAIDPSILLYGEPWAGGLTPIRITEKGRQRSRGFGVFNDDLRNAVRGSPFESEETFVMDGGRTSAVKAGIVGSIDTFCDAPVETINYVECHDNYTLWDHLRFYIRSRTDEIVYTDDDLRRMHRLAAAIVFVSQGVPFIQAGQEMCRTKHDVENSYESPDSINRIDWRRKRDEWTTVLYYRGLILLRRSNPHLFCKHTADEIRESVIFYDDLDLPVPERCIAFRISGDQETFFQTLRQRRQNASADSLMELAAQWTEVVVLLNPTPQQVLFQLPGMAENVIWFQVVDARRAGVSSLRGPAVGAVHVEGRSAAVLRKASKKDTVDAQLTLRLDAISDSYCSFHGDDALSRYAVGLHKTPSTEEAAEHRRLLDARKRFEEHQKSSKK